MAGRHIRCKNKDGWQIAASLCTWRKKKRIAVGRIRGKTDYWKQQLEEKGWKTAASGGKRMTDSSI